MEDGWWDASGASATSPRHAGTRTRSTGPWRISRRRPTSSKTLAFQDPLTGLSNRQLFNDRLAHALAGPCGTAVDVLLLDLDDFKEVNDVHGHHAGTRC